MGNGKQTIYIQRKMVKLWFIYMRTKVFYKEPDKKYF